MENKSPIAQELGRRGGEKTLERYGIDHYKKMSEKAKKARKKLSTKPLDNNQAVGV